MNPKIINCQQAEAILNKKEDVAIVKVVDVENCFADKRKGREKQFHVGN